MDKPNIIYYAHHQWKYNTKEEYEEIRVINNNFENSIIINPNGWIAQIENEEYIMEQCFQMVRNSNMIVFSSIEDGIIGKGVYDEIYEAYFNDIDIYYLNNNKLIEFTSYLNDNLEIIYHNTNNKRKYAKVMGEQFGGY